MSLTVIPPDREIKRLGAGGMVEVSLGAREPGPGSEKIAPATRRMIG
jgi:hypothetical protein